MAMKKNQIAVRTKPAQIMPMRAKMAEVGTEVGWMVPEPWVKDEDEDGVVVVSSSRAWRVGVLVLRRVRVVRRVWMAERESGMGAMVVMGFG